MLKLGTNKQKIQTKVLKKEKQTNYPTVANNNNNQKRMLATSQKQTLLSSNNAVPLKAASTLSVSSGS